MKYFLGKAVIYGAFVLLASCAFNDAAPPLSAAHLDAPSRGVSRAAITEANIYVANFYNSTVTVYDRKNYALIRTISQGVLAPDALAFDGLGNLYVASDSGAGISVYAPGGSQPIRAVTDGVSSPLTIAIDASGKLYAANPSDNVTVYAAGSGKLLRTIKSGISLARALAFDGSGNLYAANYNNSTVTVYRPGTTKPMRTISQGVVSPLALAFDKSGNLYVANFQGASVTVYAPGSDMPFRTLTQDLEGPDTLTFAPSGDLYVANCDTRAYVGCWKPSQYGVTVYGSTSDTPKFQITDAIVEPDAVLLGSSGKAIVANNGPHNHTSSLTVYAADGNSLLRTITQGIDRPVAAALGP